MEGASRIMALTLTEIRSRVTHMLMDTGQEIWPVEVLDEAVRQALAVYSQVYPCLREAIVPTPAAGDLELSSLPGLVDVIAVRWPYMADKAESLQPPNRVIGWRFWREPDRPILELRTLPGCNPLAGDPLYMRYSCVHTVTGLDDAQTGSVPPEHTALLVRGSAGYAALFRAIDKVENRSYGSRRTEPSLLQNWGNAVLGRFHQELEALRRRPLPVHTRTQWRLDRWDTP